MDNQKIYSYQCPCCGAAMTISPDQKRLTCEYCGKKLFVAQNRTTGQPELRKQNIQNTQKAIKIIVICVLLSILGSCVSCYAIALGSASRNNNRQTVELPQTIEANPYEDISVTIRGVAPNAEVYNIKSTSSIYGIKYTASPKTNLSNGDVITIKAEPMNGYTWTEDSYEYTVADLDTIITDESLISEEDMTVLHDFCIDLVTTDVYETLEQIDKEDIKLVSIEPYNIYFNVIKEPNFYSKQVELYSAYKVNFEILGVSGSFYKYVTIPNALLRSDGTLKASYDQCSTYEGFLWLEDLGINKIDAVNGFKTVLEMESCMEKEDYKLYK